MTTCRNELRVTPKKHFFDSRRWQFENMFLLYDKSHKSHNEKNVVQNAWEAVADELNCVEDGKNFCCFQCFC